MTEAEALPWVLKGEGKAGAVFSYIGQDIALKGKVLRVGKIMRKSPELPLDIQIWNMVPGIIGTGQLGDGMVQQEVFCDLLMRPLLDQFIGNNVTMTLRDVEGSSLLQQIIKHGRRPPPVGLKNTAILMEDYTLLKPPRASTTDLNSNRPFFSTLQIPLTAFSSWNSSSASQHPKPLHTAHDRGAFCLEIKPKCGFLPCSKAIHPAHAIKHRKSRFSLHQALKLHQGQIFRKSAYEPLDLFSGDSSRCQQAIAHLLDDPQNNLVAFSNGTAVPVKTFLDRLSAAIKGTISSRELVPVLATRMLQKSGVLDCILKVQKLDILDIEGVQVLFESMQAPENVEHSSIGSKDAVGGNAYDHEISRLSSLPAEQKLKIMRDYLVAATAKDCSVMVAFNCTRDDRDEMLIVNYAVRVADLDFKSVSKIPQHVLLDQEIMRLLCGEDS